MKRLPGGHRRSIVLRALGAVALYVGAASGMTADAANRIIEVGPARAIKTPSAAARFVQPGDTVRIDVGEYVDCAVWQTPNIVIEGVGGYAHVRDATCDGKAIWVFYRAPVTVRSIRMSGARVPRRNGAGIRWEGNGRLVVEDSWFHDNQMGILTHNRRRSSLVVTGSRFERNGTCETFCGHAIYAGFIDAVTVENSMFLEHRFGHHIKSRALVSRIVGNSIADGQIGTSSYAINLPNSGTAFIRRNAIQKGPESDNLLCAICIGEEIARPDDPAGRGGRANPSQGISVEGNIFRNDSGSGETVFVWNRGPHSVILDNNRLTGAGELYVAGPRPEVRRE